MHEVRLLIKEGKRVEALAQLDRLDRSSPYAVLQAACLRNQPVDPAPFESAFPRESDSENRYFAAEVMASCGHNDRTLRLLRLSLERGYSIYPAMDLNPMFAAVRSDPRWDALRREAIRYRDDLNATLAQIDRKAGRPSQ